MVRDKIGLKVNLSFGIALLIVGFLGFMSYKSVARLIEATEKFSYNLLIVSELQDYFSKLNGLESNEHAFILTGNRQFLISYEFAVKDLKQKFEKIEVLGEDTNSFDMIRTELKPSLEAHLEFSRRMVELRKARGIEPTLKLFTGIEHLRVVQSCTEITQKIMVRENDFMGEWLRLYAFNSKRSLRMIILATVLSFLFIGISAGLINRDILAKMRAEEALERTKTKLQFLLAYNPSILYSASPHKDFQATFISQNVQAHLGYFPAEIIGNDFFWWESLHREDKERILQELPKLAGSGRLYMEYRIRHKDGSYSWISDERTLVLGPDGEPREILGAWNDINMRKQAEEALRKSECLFHDLFESARDLIIVLSPAGKIMSLNPAFKARTGFSRDEWIGRPFEKLVHTDDLSIVWQNLARAARRNSTDFFELRIRGADGKYFTAELQLTAEVQNGSVTGLLGIARDITERKQAESLLREAKEAAEAATRTKSEFLANMSHEIRTPLNAVLGMGELLLETPLSPEQRDYLTILKRSGENLLGIINKILDFSKIEAGRLDLESIGFDLPLLIEETIEARALEAHEKGLELACRLDPAVPAGLVGDPVRLKQILMNLIGNAIKFTEEGEVVLSVKCRAREDSEAFLLFSISDTGIGIPREKLDLIFESFTQADSSVTRKYGGTGLGTAISKQLVQMMRGRIWAESKPGEGSAFHFTATFGIGAETTPPSPEIDLSGARMLLIDDNDTNRSILREMLSGWGAVVEEAGDGPKGIDKLKSALKEGEPFDILLLDGRMPGMDGFEAARRIKEENILPQTIIMLTSDKRISDMPRAKALGIENYLVKPVRRSKLAVSLKRAMGICREEECATAEEHVNPVDNGACRIFLVEDSTDNRLLIKSFLKNTPHVVDTAENGVEALEKFKTGRYDLVLMDMQMPVMDGYTATRLIREWEKKDGASRHTPIIALTAHAREYDNNRTIEAGCDLHLTKPVKKEKLLESIKEMLKRRQEDARV